jgi:hypothetical protein
MLGGNIMTDAFGIVAMIAMAPLIAIQVLGFTSKVRAKRKLDKVKEELGKIRDDMFYFDKEISK